MKNKNILFAVVLSAFVVGVMSLMLYRAASQNNSVANTAASNLYKAEVGGNFTLTNHNGQTVTNKDYLGKYMVVFFGYTYCPDVCPTALQNMTDALDMLADKAEFVQPLFITVDPERDTPAVLNNYVKNFHPSLVALTGNDQQIAIAGANYRAYYAKAIEPGADQDDYLMAHSSIIYLMGPDGKFISSFNHETSPEKMANTLKKYLL